MVAFWYLLLVLVTTDRDIQSFYSAYLSCETTGVLGSSYLSCETTDMLVGSSIFNGILCFMTVQHHMPKARSLFVTRVHVGTGKSPPIDLSLILQSIFSVLGSFVNSPVKSSQLFRQTRLILTSLAEHAERSIVPGTAKVSSRRDHKSSCWALEPMQTSS